METHLAGDDSVDTETDSTGSGKMATRKTYQVIIEFTFCNGQSGGKLDSSPLLPKSQIRNEIENCREWLAVKGHTETSLVVIDSNGHVLHDSKPRQQSEHERGLERAAAGRTATKHWDWPGLR